jgi:hypothetical protein
VLPFYSYLNSCLFEATSSPCVFILIITFAKAKAKGIKIRKARVPTLFFILIITFAKAKAKGIKIRRSGTTGQRRATGHWGKSSYIKIRIKTARLESLPFVFILIITFAKAKAKGIKIRRAGTFGQRAK